jgi:hypothetical protein
MPRRKSGQKAEREHHYFRVVITYSDGETSGNRVFKDRAKAERWAARQEKSGVVKKVSVEEFVREPQIERLVYKKRRGSNMNWRGRALVLTAEVAINPPLRPCSELSIMQGLVLWRGQTCQATLERRCAELGSLALSRNS